jgi:hypothetical protein
MTPAHPVVPMIAVRRGHMELGIDAHAHRRVSVAFTDLAEGGPERSVARAAVSHVLCR